VAKTNKRDLTRDQVAKILEDFLEGTGGDWEGFTDGGMLSDSFLEEIRMRSMELPREFPPTTRHEYSNAEGRQVLRNYVLELRRSPGLKSL